MALGDIQWLQWKNKSTRERDAREYEEWAFPYGEKQRDVISSLLKEFFPKEDSGIALVCFLTAKEIVARYKKIWNAGEHYEYTRKSLGKDLNRYKRMFRKGSSRYVYAALSFLDLDITEELAYPETSEILALAETLEKEVTAVLEK